MTKIHSILVALLALGVCMIVTSPPAFAAREYIPGVPFGSPGSGDGQFNEPAGVAVNEASPLTEPVAGGDVYVVDKGNDRVERFSATGEYKGRFDGSETPAKSFSSPEQIAVDNSGNPLDPSANDVYVLDTGDNVIDKFSATGQYKSQLAAAETCNPATCKLSLPSPGMERTEQLVSMAVDPSGNLWVFTSVTETYKEGNAYITQTSEFLNECSDTGVCATRSEVYFSPGNGMAVDPSETAYTLQGREIVQKVNTATGKTEATISPEGASALAMNFATTNLLVDKGNSIALFGPIVENNQSPHETFATGGLSDSRGIAVNGAAPGSTVYASQSVADSVETFESVPVPGVVTQAPSGVSETGMTLHGAVNPEGELVKECYFEYGTEAGVYTNRVACEPPPGKGAGQIGEGSTPVPVSAPLSGLPPASVRSFRLVAVSAAGIAAHANGASISVPTIDGEAPSGVGSVAATVRAQINPGGLATTYSFEYGTSLAYGSQTPEASVVGDEAGSEAVGVSAQLSGLQPETVYHLRVVARNALGAILGKDFTLTTFPSQVAGLPDGRVYELVSSSPQGHDAEVYVPTPLQDLTDNEEHGIWTGRPFEVSPDGEAVAYAGDAPPTSGTSNIGGSNGTEYLASRAPDGGWTQAPLEDEGTGPSATSAGFSSDLSIGVFEGEGIPGTGAPSGYHNFYTHATAVGAAGAYQPFYVTTPDRSAEELTDSDLEYAGGNAGTSAVPAFSHVLFELNGGLLAGEGQLEQELGEDVEKEVEEKRALDEEATRLAGKGETGPAEEKLAETERDDSGLVHYLYDSVDGRLYLVDVLPNGKVAPGATFGSLEEYTSNGYSDPDFTGVISADGSRVFWTAAPEVHAVKKVSAPFADRSNGVYVRENDTQPQSPLNGEECTVPADACTVQVAPSGSIFQTASADGSRAFYISGSNELYEYDLETGETIELAPGVEVKGVAGISENGEYVYYVDSRGNIELWHDGATTLVAAEAGLGGDSPFPSGHGGGGNHSDYVTELGSRTAEVTPDGQSIIFMSTASLTGYDNVLAGTALDEVFLYEAGSSSESGSHPPVLRCVSCNPSGEPPVPNLASGPLEKSDGEPVGAFLAISGKATYQPQSITDDGSRVFFDSAEPLVPQATNGWVDDYEWERDGTGSCETSTGCIYLLSGGTVPESSYLIGASASGDDVFFISRADLVPADRGGDDFVIYDARVGGVQPPAAPACSGTGCQGVPPPPPIFATPSSVTFNGVGNFAPAAPPVPVKKVVKKAVRCRHGFVKSKKHRCVKKAAGKKGKKAKKASNNRRGRR